MTLLRTIFTHCNRHLRCHACTSSSLLSLRSLQTSPFHSSAITDSSELEQPQTIATTHNTTRNPPPPNRWSVHGDLFHSADTKHKLSNTTTDHDDNDDNDTITDDDGGDGVGEVENFPIEKQIGRRVKRVGNTLQGSGGGDVVPGNMIGGGRRKGKGKTQWVCGNCGYTAGQWWGVCPSCTIGGTMKEFHEAKTDNAENSNKVRSGLVVSEDAVGLWLPQRADQLHPVKLEEVNRGYNHQKWRITLPSPFGNEVSTVLGGGLVPGSLTLVGGDPGVGKSTLLLQIAALIGNGCNSDETSPVLYVSGEESLEQIGNRADRLRIKSDIYLYSSTDIEDILKKAQHLSPRALVVDSIQTVYLKGLIGSAGGIVQVKECTSALMRFAKTTNIPVLLIGHVTKSGDIAGPRVLEHIVDVVLYMEGEKYSSYRMLRAVKNRFGSADELGVFEMSKSGLYPVSNASEMFLGEQHPDSEFLAGLAIAVIMDGSRTFLIEIQALCLSDCPVPVPSAKLVNGIETSRANMIKCVLIKQAGLQLQENAVFLNVVSGLTMTETAGDLAIAAAICSSFLEFPIPKGVAFIGEIGLGGELRMVPRIEKRVYTVAKLGYEICVIPKQAEKVLETDSLGKMTLVGCKNLKEVVNAIFCSKMKRQ